MVCRVRQATPDRQLVPYQDEYDESETEPDDSDLLTDPDDDDCIEVLEKISNDFRPLSVILKVLNLS